MADTAKHGLGDIVDIRCRFCRLNLDASVSALGPDGSIMKVQCRTCKHFQDFKAPVPVEDQRAALLKKVMKIAERHTRGSSDRSGPAIKTTGILSAEVVARALWEEATVDANPLKSKIYDQHRVFLVDDLITCKGKGLGVVREVDDQSILVLFREGFERLPQGQPRDE
jgi:phage FluMu protein Com